MRKVILKTMEDNKYQIIKKLVETQGNKKTAAVKLAVSLRTINRLIIYYRNRGKSGFVHGNRERTPATTYSLALQEKVVNLYRNKYYDANLVHFCELLSEHEQITLSRNTISKWLRKHLIISPKARRITKRKLKEEIKKTMDTSKDLKEIQECQQLLPLVEPHKVHPTQSRPANRGESVQMDASSMCWFDGIETHLHLAIDDADGSIVGGFFDYQETLYGYYNVLKQILINHGIPIKFKVDRRTIFDYQSRKSKQDYDDTYTQFGYACKTLGIAIDASSIPQKKGRVERLNQTLQSRLLTDLRLAGVTTIEAANDFLRDYIPKYNKQFAIKLNTTRTVYEKQPSNEVINQTLAIITRRVVDSGHSLKYRNSIYLPYDEFGNPVYTYRGTQAMIIEAFDKTLLVNINDQLFFLKETPKYIDPLEQVPTIKKSRAHIPALNHPWRQAPFNSFVSRQKHRMENGANY